MFRRRTSRRQRSQVLHSALGATPGMQSPAPRSRRASAQICEPLEPRTLLAAVNWTGLAGDNLWTTPGNWSSTPSLPGPADDVTISVAANPTITLNSGTQTINSLTSDEALTISNSARLNVASASTINGTATLQTGATLEGAGTITFNGVVSASNAQLIDGGTTIMSATSSLQMSGSGLDIARSLDVFGTATLSSTTIDLFDGSFNLKSGATLTATGTTGLVLNGGVGNFTLDGTLSIPSGTFTAPSTIAFGGTGTAEITGGTFTLNRNASIGNLSFSSGTLGGTGEMTLTGSASSWTGGTMSGAGKTIIASGATLTSGGAGTKTANRPLQNDGTVNVTGGTLSLAQGATHTGPFNVAAGTTLLFSSSSSGDSLLTSTSTVSGAGNLQTNTSGVFTQFDGAINIGGNGNFSGTTRLFGAFTCGGNVTISAGTTSFQTSAMIGGAVNITGGVLNAIANQTFATVNLSGSGTLWGNGDVTITGTFNWTGGTVGGFGTGQTIIAASGVMDAGNTTSKTLSSMIVNHNNQASGTRIRAITFQSTGKIENHGRVRVDSFTTIGVSGVGGVFDNQGTLDMLGGSSATTTNFNVPVVNTGTITTTRFGVVVGDRFNFASIDNQGTLEVKTAARIDIASTAQFSGTTLMGGDWIVGGDAILNFPAGASIQTNAADVTFEAPGSSFPAINSLASNTGTLTLANGKHYSPTPTGGTLVNTGTIRLLPGKLTVMGNFTQPGSSLIVDIAGPTPQTDFGQVAAMGAVSLNGSLVANLIGGYDPSFTVSFPVVVAGTTLTGTFSSFNGGSTPSSRLLRDRYDPTTAFVSVRPLAGGAADLAASSDSGISSTDDLTNDSTPTFTGTAGEGTTARIYSDGNLVGSGPISAGTWSVTTSVLSDGPHVITTTVVDGDGDESPASGGPTVTIDTIAPPVPAAADLQAGSDSGVLSTDNITNDATPTLDINATPFYRLLRDGTQVSGDYDTAATFTSGALADAAYDFTVRAVDAAGNASADSTALNVTVDTLAPAVPTAPDLQAGSDSGVSSSDNITNDATPTFDIASTDTYFRFERGGTQTSGDYETGSTYTTAPQGDGPWSYGIRAVDAAGNASASSTGLNVTIDTLAPAVPVAPDLQAASDSGRSSSDNITNDTTPTFDVVSTDAYYRVLRDGAQVSGDYDNAATYTSSLLGDAAYSFAIRAVDAAGNASAPSGGLSVTIDTLAPATPGAPDLAAGSDSGVSNSDDITNDNTPTFEGTVEADADVHLFAEGNDVGSMIAVGGTYGITATTLADGERAMTVRATDVAGNESAPSGALSVTIDTVAPQLAGLPQFLFATAPHRLRYAFSENVGPTLGTDDIVVQQLPSTNIPTAVTYNGAVNEATFTFPGEPGGILPNARFEATLLSAGITDVAGNMLDVPAPDGDSVFAFLFLRGDANHDGRVNLDDFNILAANFGQSPRDFTQGDFDYSGNVNLNDFNILAARFGMSIGPDDTITQAPGERLPSFPPPSNALGGWPFGDSGSEQNGEIEDEPGEMFA